ncbi:hypothetical protein BSKO_01762 [Bryopsis sp. KO-2023]|nr:hypothetical protein BSKO_01762 [Bryopsis sp. KO-2023]
MAFEITPKSLKKLCRELKLYASVPELNDILYLQHKGITKLENLDEYTGLKTLYLECNAICTIQGLEKLRELRCLYLGQNIIRNIEGMEMLMKLQTLDLSQNDIHFIDNLSCLPLLSTLNISCNKLQTKADIQHLSQCPCLTSLDLSKNQLKDAEAFDFVIRLGSLSFLRLAGNPFVTAIRSYRKRVLAEMPSLNHFDDSPCFEKDRRLAQAFTQGGVSAERAMREHIRKEEDDKRAQHLQEFNDMVERAKNKAKISPPFPYDPMRFRAVPIGESEDEAEDVVEHMEVVEDEPPTEEDPSVQIVHVNEAGELGSAELKMEETDNTGDAILVDSCGDASSTARQTEEQEAEERMSDGSTTMERDDVLKVDNTTEFQADIDNEESLERSETPHASDQMRKKDMVAQIKEGVRQFRADRCGRRTRERLEARESTQSPRVWGTKNYKTLWSMALELGSRKQLEAAPLEQSNLANMDATTTPVADDVEERGEERHRAPGDEATHQQGKSENLPVSSQTTVEESDTSFLAIQSSAGSGGQIELEFDDSDDSEWEMEFGEDVDPLERYTISAVATGRGEQM